MAVITMRQMLEAGVHFGHQTRRWNPKMKRFIFGERNGIYIIDLEQTLGRVETAYGFVRDLVGKGGTILFVGTKKQAQDPVRSYAEKCGMPFVNERWLGGMLTNFDTISKRVGKMLEYERMQASGEFEAMPKKEALLLTREMEKLQRNLGGLRGLTKRPDAVFILDTKKEHIAVTEANKLGIPVVAVVDTNVDPELVQYPIPGNDDAIRANSLLSRVIADAVAEGRYVAGKRDRSSGVVRPRPCARLRKRRPSPPSRPKLATRRRGPRPSARLASPPPSRAPRVTTSRPRSCRPSPTRSMPTPASPWSRWPMSPSRSLTSRLRPSRRPTSRLRPRKPSPTTARPPSRSTSPPPRPEPVSLTTTTTRQGADEMAFTAKDVQALRQATGAGMMDAKKALEANDGDIEEAKQWLREKGLSAAAKRDDRENSQGVVALVVEGAVGAIVELKSETDFVAGSEHFKQEAQNLAELVVAKGVDAVAERQATLEDLKITLKEKIELGRVERLEASDGQVIDSYLHVQNGRGVNAVLVVLDGGDAQLAHDIAVHVAFARPKFLRREDIPTDVVDKERATFETISRNEGKPEAALPKIVEGRLTGFFKDVALLDQPYAKDDKQSVTQVLGGATIVAYAQVEIGA